MEQKEIKVLMVAPGEHPREIVLKNDLDALQKAVSIGCDYQGLIEGVVRYVLPMANVIVFLVLGRCVLTFRNS